MLRKIPMDVVRSGILSNIDLQARARLALCNRQFRDDYHAYLNSLSPLTFLFELVRLPFTSFARFLNLNCETVLAFTNWNRCKSEDDSVARDILYCLTVNMSSKKFDVTGKEIIISTTALINKYHLPEHILHSMIFFSNLLYKIRPIESAYDPKVIFTHFSGDCYVIDGDLHPCYKNVRGLVFRHVNVTNKDWSHTDFRSCMLQYSSIPFMNLTKCLFSLSHDTLNVMVVKYVLSGSLLNIRCLELHDDAKSLKNKLDVILIHFKTEYDCKVLMNEQMTDDCVAMRSVGHAVAPLIRITDEYFQNKRKEVLQRFLPVLRQQIQNHVDFMSGVGKLDDALAMLSVAKEHKVFSLGSPKAEVINQFVRLFGGHFKLSTAYQREFDKQINSYRRG